MRVQRPDGGGTVAGLFAAQAERSPGAVAVLAGEEALTYEELDARADRLARRLRALGVGPEVPVAVCAGNSPGLLVAVLATWKAGGAFVPLDPSYPRERLRFVLEDAGAPVVLTLAHLKALLPPHRGRVLLLDADAAADGDAGEPAAAAPGADPENLAYVIYTSGSTGTPKGVRVEHGSLAGTLLGACGALGFGAGDVMPSLASFAFDIWLLETFAPLLAGGAVRLVPRERVRDAEALVDALADCTALHAVPALMREVAGVARARGGDALPRLRLALVGGDAVAPDLLDDMRDAFSGARVHVLYGPTEAAIVCASFAVPAEGSVPRRMIGRALPGAGLHVLDEGGDPVPDGTAGELWVGGPGVARGYLGRPELTAEKFVPDALSGAAGSRLYRTGDRASRLPDGALEFLGRVDQQVKVRGFRIEPGEVEGVLSGHPAVRDAAVVARDDAPGGTRLVGYVVPEGGAAASPAELRAWLGERLPEHMVPSALVVLEALPLTPTGKVDRRALPAPEAAGGHVAPRTPTEALLAGLWAELLGTERVGATDDFFALGGHSLLAGRLAARVRARLGVDLPVRAVFDAPTLEELAREVDRARGDDAAEAPPIPAAGDGDLPLSFAQERLWVLDALATGSAAYDKLLAFRLRGRLDVPALRSALDALVRRHEALRTVFPAVGSRPVQRVLPARGVALPAADLAALPEADREAAVSRHARDEAGRGWTLAREPLFRALLLRCGDDEHVLLLSTHHIVTDGWSLGVLFRDLGALYAAAATGEAAGLPPLPVRYADYAEWQRDALAGEALERPLAFWRTRLSGVPALLELPTDRPRPPARTGRGRTLRWEVPEGTAARLRALGRAEGATLFMTLLAAWQLLLARYSGQEDVVVGTPVAGRPHPALEELVGFFVNTLALRGDLSGMERRDFRGLLARTREEVLAAYAHQDLPFEKVVEDLRVERSLAYHPLFQVMLVLQNTPGEELRLPGLTLRALEVETGTAKFDLLLEAAERGGGLACALEYAADLFDASTAERMAAHLGVLLASVADRPGRSIGDADLLPAAERRQVLRGWNETARPYPERACVHHLAERQAARTPDAVAVAFRGGALTYAELDARASRLARFLLRSGVGPDVPVGLCVERGPEMMVGVLGILKAGGAYLPLDPAYPAERLAFMLADARVPVLLTQESLAGSLPAGGAEVVCLDSGWERIAREGPTAPAVPVDPDNLAFVVYTSGSTGRPKGVAMTHRPLVNLVAWQEGDWRGPRAAATLQFATISFDASFHEIFSAWSTGGRVVLIAEEQRYDPAGLLEVMEREGVERVFLPWVALQHVAETADARGIVPSRLREVQTAGEALRVTGPIRRWLRALGAPLHNHYGPSETHVVTAHALEGDPGAWPLLPPIGRPIANTQCYVLDRALHPAPVGVPGELYVGGASLARGYLGRADATAERFVPDPFAEQPGARAYRTGDRVRWLADGTLEFLGRADTQVKIRGFRIEPGEVEALLEAHPGVREAVVVAREDRPGEKRLVAYVVPEGGAVPVAELRAHVRDRLPEYMVPAAFVPLGALPLTPSGKTDRRALPAPERADDGDGYLAPRTWVEEVLAGIWGEVLKLARVGVRDDFFALGGHSLVGTQVISRVREACGVELPLRALFEASTVEGLAARVERDRGESGPAGPAVAMQRAPRDRPLPLSFSQQRLWFVDQLEPGNPVYNLSRTLRMRRGADARVLARCLEEIVRRHEPLRTVFAEVEGTAVQVIRPAGEVPLPVLDLSALPAGEREDEARRRVAAEATRPFDLARGPLFRPLLVKVDEREWVLLACMHHVVSDGWSMGVFFRELAALHEAFARGEPSPLPEPEVQYADYALWQQRWLAGETLEEQLRYWRERLAGAPAVLELPADRPRPPVPARRGATVSRVLTRAGAEALRGLARREGATLFMTLLAAFDVLLARWSGQEDVVVGTPTAGRGRREVEGLIGFFVNTLAMRTGTGGDPTFRELLARVRETALGAHSHQDLPFERLVEELQPERSLAHTPVFQVVFSVEDAAVLPVALPGAEVGELYLDEEVSDFDMGFRIQERGDGLRLLLHYRTDLFDASTMERMLDGYALLLDGAAAEPGRRILDLPLVRDEDRRLLEGWGEGPALPEAAEEGVHRLFGARARSAPGAVAVRFGEERVTYAELDRWSDRLAGALRRRGVGRGARVGVCVERGPRLLAALLATWKAGGVYLPLDPTHPAGRLAFLLRDSGAGLLLTESPLAPALSQGGVPALLLDLEEESPAAERGAAPAAAAGPGDTAYLIYTSGSTGTPKAVMVAHAQLAHTLRGSLATLGLAPDDVVASLASAAFDISLLELLAPLLVGGSTLVVPRAQVLDAERLVEAAAGATVLHAVPALMRQVVHAARRAGGLPRLRLLLVGGDTVPPDLLEEMRGAFPAARTRVLYGPTETTLVCASFPVPPGGEVQGHPIGAPLPGVRLRVCDARGEPVPVGVPGEIVVAGGGVAQGYLDRPELSAEKFAPVGGERAYRTGDRGRWRADGTLEFLGRLDEQVKVRGFRIEPGEVEAALLLHPGVVEAAVAVRDDLAGERGLAAYYTAAGAPLSPYDLREHLLRSLPEYMLPAAFVRLDALPLTANGKVDRRLLPAPERGWTAAAYAAPRTFSEEVLAGVWADVLGVERVGVHDNFFDLGGHSLLATRMVSRARAVLRAEIPLRALFEAQTVAELAARVDAERRTEEDVEPPPLVPADRGVPLPLSFAQERLWFLHRLAPESAAYNTPTFLRLRGRLDAPALRRALAALVERHESLRTVFPASGGRPVQRVAPFAGFPLPVQDLSRLDGAAREAEMVRRVHATIRRPFDLEAGPLFHAALLRLDGEDHVLALATHHVVSDEWSKGVLLRELDALYGALSRGESSALPAPVLQYADYAVWQRGWLRGEALERQVAYWRERLAGAPPLLELPTDRPRTRSSGGRRATHAFTFPDGVAEGLRALARREGATLFMTVLAGFQALLARWSGQDDVLVGTPVAGRNRAEVEGMVGFFVNTLVLRAELPDDAGGLALLEQARERVLEAQMHQDVPFERLVEELRVERSLSHTPLFQVMFSLSGARGRAAPALGELEVEELWIAGGETAFDLGLVVTEEGGRLAGDVDFRAGLFDGATVERMAGHLRILLEGMLADPGLPVSGLPLLAPGEREQVVEGWSVGTVGSRPPACLHELFAEQAARTPGAPALVHGETGLTYAELEARARSLAGVLRARGIGPEVRAGVCMERGVDAVVALLGVLEAGGVYVPLDPAYPAERLAFMLADSGARVVLTAARFAGRLPEFDGEIVALDTPGENDDAADEGGNAVAGCPLFPVPCSLAPDHLAYVVYTSGSTGTPKGVMVSHGAATGLLSEAVETFGAGPGSRVVQTASLSFDASLLEVFLALLSGAALHVADRETVLSGTALGTLLREREIDVWVSTPPLLESLPDTDFPALRTVSTGGERCTAELAARWSAGRRLLNMYGPTEATIYATGHPCAAGAPQAPPIGRPVAGARAYVLDRRGEPVPAGVPGELYLGGAGLARGYLGRPGLTAGRFVPDGVSGAAGARLYRTGDRARWLASGELEFLGRVDEQVKLRGLRIEPGEVEAALLEHPGVRAAAVAVREDAPGRRALVAYVAAADGDVSAAEVRERARRRLPEYMVPAAVVVLEALPLTPAGKLDRRALPAPAEAGGEGYVAPRTPAEQVLAGIFAEVLGLERVGAHDGFFELGGHSLLATRVASRVPGALGVELPLRALFEAPTVAGLAARVEGLLRDGDGVQAPPVVRVPRDPLRPLPLSFAQQRLWFIDRLEPGSTAYNVPLPLRLRGRLDARTLERALGEVVRRHEALRTVFGEVGGEPVQTVRPAGAARLPAADLSGLPDDAREAEARRLAADDARRPFDLRRGPLLRAALLRLAPDDHVLTLAMHHVVSDGWSMGVLFREVAALYEAFARGEPSPLPEPEVQYADWALWQRQWLAGGVLERQLAWWRERLEGAPPTLELPVDRARGAVPGARGATVARTLPREAAERLRALARAEGATTYMVLLAGLDVLLARWSGQEDVVVGSPVAGRTRRETEGLIGFFVNTIVLRADVSGNPPFRELLGRVREATLGAYQHQDLPFERLVEELGVERSLSHTPLFQVLFALDDGSGSPLPFGGMEVEPYPVDGEVARFDLMVSVRDADDGIELALVYREELWEAATLERMAGAYALLLESAAADPARRILDLPLATEAETARVLREWSAGPALDVAPRSVYELFAAQAARTPGAPAVVHGDAVLTYAELEARACRLAARLRALGVGPESRVGICMERGPGLMAAVLAVLAAGGAYVPLDPGYPRERLAYVLADAGVGVLLTEEHLAARLPDFGGEVVLPDGDGHEDTGALPHPPPSPDNLAYVIYTSGSTGTPKGVAMTQGALVNLLCWQQGEWRHPGAATLQFTSIGFDVSFQEIFSCWLSGGRLVLLGEEERRDPALVLERLESGGVERLFLPYVALQQLAELGAERGIYPSALREVQTAGEQLRVTEPIRRWLSGTGAALTNQYGPSETHVATAHALAGLPGEWPLLPPIGRPVANARCLVLDARGEPAPAGVPGELYLGGACLARGYLGRPGLTAEKWVPDPFAAEPGARLYRTGDRARWRGDGTLEFLGRADQQVKVRGFRIEPGEIEATLERHPGVREALVAAREDGAGERRLVAYLVAAEGGAPAPEALRAHLGATLPDYMVPAAFVLLDSLPLTATGKVDRRALPAPEPAGAAGEHAAPRTPTEEVLAGIWAAVLGIERVGRDAGFWELGGHSLLATRVAARVREAFGVELPLRALFEAPTVAALAARVDALAGSGGGSPAPPLVRAPRDRPLPLSFAQRRLWFIDQLEPGTAAYTLPVQLRLRGPLDAAALGRALDELARRHEALRTVFAVVDGEPVQVVRPAPRGVLAEVELSGLGPAAAESEARRLSAAEVRRPFDLARGPLFRATLLRLGAQDAALLLSLHHAVSDGWSMGVLKRELSVLYGAFLAGEASPLPELAFQYGDWAAWQRAWLRGETLERQTGFWRERLAGAPPVLELPADAPRPAVQGHRGARATLLLPRPLADELRALARREGATLFMTLLAAWKLLLARLAGQDDVVVGTPVAGRSRTEAEGLVGFFVNSLALRTDLSGDPAFRELLGRVRETTLGAYQHQDLPFEQVLEAVRPERSLSHAPVFQVFFNLFSFEEAEVDLPGLAAEPMPWDAEEQAKFDLTLYVLPEEDGIWLSLLYDADLFNAERTAEMLEQFRLVLEHAVRDPGAAIASYSLVTPSARERLPDPALPLDGGWLGSVPAVFAAHAARAPERLAVEDAEERWSYGELDARSRQLARWLAAHGVAPGDVVAVYGHRSASLVWALLGILRAGAAFLVLDPAYPALRLASYLRIARPAGWLRIAAAGEPPAAVEEAAAATARCRLVLPGRAEAARAGLLADQPAEDPGIAIGPDSLAYLSFTSGTTGTPKAVMGRHGSLTHFLPWLRDEFALDEADRFTLLSGLGHDPLQRDVFTPLQLGAAVCVPDAGAWETRGGLARWMRDARVTVAHLTPAMGKLVTDRPPEQARETVDSLRLVFLVGEALTRADVARLQGLAPRVQVVNYYGSTETQRAVGWFPVPDGFVESSARDVVPLGRGIPDVQLLVLNRAGALAGVGEPGEIHLRSPHVALGYLDDPALTAERFLANPLGAGPDDRVYRTGDLGRYRPDGVVEPLGRADRQAKIRGFRVEPGEVEAALAEHPAVREATVAVRGDAAGEARLAAYVVPAAEAPDPAELRAWLRERLPEHMVPASLTPLEALPLTPNGKLDRGALPEPAWAPSGEEGPDAAPRTPTEEVLAGIWSESLGVERVGPDADYFALGGHSLAATGMLSRVRAAFGVEVPLRAVFEAPVLRRLAERIDGLAREGAGAVLPPLVRAPRDRPLPLSFAQQRLWFIDRLDPGARLYGLSFALRVRGVLDEEALRRALGETVRRHEVLRTRFTEAEGEPAQAIDPPAPAALPRVDLRALPEEARCREARRLAEAGVRHPFDLCRGPLFRATLLDLAEDERVLLLAVHHIVWDGWSTGVFNAELSALYADFAAGREPSLPEPPFQYADYAVWQRGWLAGETLESQLAWWRARLAGAPPLLELPTDFSRPATPGAAAARVYFEVPERVARGLHALARGQGATIFMVLLAAWQLLLSRYAGQDDVVTGAPIAGRRRVELERMLGFFVNTLALRTDLSGDPTLGGLLRRVREATLGAFQHQDVPFERLVDELGVERSLGRSPVFQNMFAVQNQRHAELRLAGLRLEPFPTESDAARTDLGLTLMESGQGLLGMLVFRTELWEAASVQRLLGHFLHLLAEAGAGPDRRISELRLLGDDERAQLLAGWNPPPRAAPRSCVHELISEQAARTPDAPAVVSAGTVLTYAGLDARSDAIARVLRARDVGPESPVGLCVERSPEMVAAVLGILKAGGAYVPLDPEYPAERLAFMLADSGALLLLTDGASADRLPDFAGETVVLDGTPLPPAPSPARGEGENDRSGNGAAVAGCSLFPVPCSLSLAYVIYTSGSTGTPKGVRVTHGALANTLLAAREAFGFAEGDRMPSLASSSFDIWLFEVLLPLLSGGSVRIVPRERVVDVAALVEELEGATLLHAVPALMRGVVERVRGTRGTLPALRRAFVGGDAVPPELPGAMREVFPAAEVRVLYGPTEGAIICAAHHVRDGEAGGRHLLGGPLGNAPLYLLDAAGEPAPAGVAGELFVGGAGLARDYLGRADLTAERFVPDPFSAEAGARMYRTGDRARRSSGGTLEFLGRTDAQVKVRGFRIEPGEVEARLAAHPGVREAVVVARPGADGEARLLGYAAAREGAERPSGRELRDWLRGRLPEHMVPADVMVLDELPLTPTGKTDRRALPEPGGAGGEAWVAPRTPVEELVAEAWAEVLGAARVGAGDSFFALGGHSLQATRVVARLRAACGVDLPVRALFETRTLAELAERVEAALEEQMGELEMEHLEGLSDEEIQRLLEAT